jgi:hypothetical protein
MHIEHPEQNIHSLKEFMKHYLMIVLSILTALGLEQWIVSMHQHHAASAASAQIENEIRMNLASIHNARGQDIAQAAALDELRDDLVHDLKTESPNSEVVQHILARTSSGRFNLNLKWPTLRHEAWDVAVADQSASWIESSRMHRYSAAYAGQRDAIINMNTDIALVLDGPCLIDTLTDLRTASVEPRNFLHVVGQMAAMLNESQNSLAQLEKQLDDALPRESTPSSGAPPTP